MRKAREATDVAGQAGVTAPHRLFAYYPGTAGDDFYTGSDGDDEIHGADGNDTLTGGGGNDQVFGDDGNDTLYAGTGTNTLAGGGGNDLLYSIGGMDTLDGGEGYDIWRASYETSVVGMRFDLPAGEYPTGTTLQGIERAEITAGYGADTFVADARITFRLDGGGGEDQLDLDLRATAQRGDRNFTLLTDSDGISGYADLWNGVSYLGNMDRVSITNADDGRGSFRIVAMDRLIGSELAINAGLGYQYLRLELRSSPSMTFTVGDDGVARAGNATFAGFEAYSIVLWSGVNQVTTGAGADSISTYTLGRPDTTHHISTMGGNDSIRINYNSGVAIVDGGEGVDSLQMNFTETVTFDDRTGVFSNGSTAVNIETYVFYSFRGTLNLSTGGTIYVAESYFSDPVNVVVDRSGTTDGVRYDMDSEFTFLDTEVVAPDTVKLIAGSGDDYVYYARGQLVFADGGDGIDTLQILTGGSLTLLVGADGAITSPDNLAGFEIFRLVAGSANNVITTGGFADQITIYGGNNTLAGGSGDDTITVTYLRGEATGANSISGEGGNDTIAADRDADLLRGGDGDDIVRAGAGNDRAFGDAGNDLLQGDVGDDRLQGGAGNDIIDGQDGFDIASYADAASRVVVTLASSAQQDTRGAGLDLLVGIEGLIGSDHADVLTGGTTANRLVGGHGADRLIGGRGADTFVFAALGDFAAKAGDRILDFSHAQGDRIDLSAIDPDAAAAGDQTFSFIGGAAFSRDPATFEVRVVEQAGSTLVKIDVDHDGRADHVFAVVADAPLTAADFVL